MLLFILGHSDRGHNAQRGIMYGYQLGQWHGPFYGMTEKAKFAAVSAF